MYTSGYSITQLVKKIILLIFFWVTSERNSSFLATNTYVTFKVFIILRFPACCVEKIKLNKTLKTLVD